MRTILAYAGFVLLVTELSMALRADEPVTYYVAVDGRDDSPGTNPRPFATLARARDAIRAGRHVTGAVTPALVVIAPGVYQQQRPLVLGEQDSKTTYRSETLHTARISGGVSLSLNGLPVLQDAPILNRLSDPMRSAVKVIDLARCAPGLQADEAWPDAFRGYAGWPEVFIGGKPLRLARWPNDGYVKIDKVIDSGSRPRFQETPDRPGSFSFRESAPTTWSLDQEIFLGGYWCHAWYDEVLRVRTIDPVKKVVHFAAPHHYGIGGRSRSRYYAINVLETLDQPGEYIYDRKASKIYLIPPVGESDECMVALSRDPLVRVVGAEGIRLDGLQLESGRGIGVEIRDSRGILLENCVIRNFPGFGVTISGGSRCGVVACQLYGLGHGGVSLHGGDRASLTPGAHFVTDCEIHHYARLVQTYQPAVGLSGVGQYVAYNFIHDAPHQAVSFSGNAHAIEHNRIERVCLDTGDAGAIYCGRDWTLQGNVIQKNWFSHLGKGLSHHNWAIYPDDQASGITARHNIVVECPSGFLFGGGRDNVIDGNLFVAVGEWPIRFDKRGISWHGRHERTLQEKLAAVPHDAEPWRSRYPTLVGLAADAQRNWPAGNVIRGNTAVSSATDNIDPKVKECGDVAPTVQIKSSWMPRLVGGRVVFPEDGPELPVGLLGFAVGPRSSPPPEESRDRTGEHK